MPHCPLRCFSILLRVCICAQRCVRRGGAPWQTAHSANQMLDVEGFQECKTKRSVSHKVTSRVLPQSNPTFSRTPRTSSTFLQALSSHNKRDIFLKTYIWVLWTHVDSCVQEMYHMVTFTCVRSERNTWHVKGCVWILGGKEKFSGSVRTDF